MVKMADPFSNQDGGLSKRPAQTIEGTATEITEPGAEAEVSADAEAPAEDVQPGGSDAASAAPPAQASISEMKSFVTHLAGPELRVFLNPRVQWSAFYQHNTAAAQGSLNARFSWEFAPLSYLFVVYNDRQPTPDGTSFRTRSLIVKLSWLHQL